MSVRCFLRPICFIQTFRSCRFKLLQHTEQKKSTDGLNSLKYRLMSISYSRLYTLIQVRSFTNIIPTLRQIKCIFSNLNTFRWMLCRSSLTIGKTTQKQRWDANNTTYSFSKPFFVA